MDRNSGMLNLNPTRTFMAILVICWVFAGSVFGSYYAPANSNQTSDQASNSNNRYASAEERQETTLRLVQLLRAKRIPEARQVMRSHLRKYPTDGNMYYNLACMDMRLNEIEQALVDLEIALENGYTNFRLVEIDGDLEPIREDPRFVEMTARFEDVFRKEFHARALILDEGYPSEPFALMPNQPGNSDSRISNPEVSVGFSNENLTIELSVTDPFYSEGNTPWLGGSGVLVNLVLPISMDDYDSERYFSYGFFSADGIPRAAIVSKHGETILKSVPDLEPEITHLGDEIKFNISIPWDHFAPYAPPLDQDLGLNIFYLGAGSEESRPVFSLMTENGLSYGPNTWRRFVPISFWQSERTKPAMKGRLYERFFEGGDLGGQFAIWSESEGPGQYTLSIHSANQPDVSYGSPVVENFQCETELNFFNFSNDLSELPAGSFKLNLEVTGPDGLTFSNTFEFDNFGQDWLDKLNERVHVMDTPEKSTLMYHLFTLSRMTVVRHPHDDSSGLHQAYAEVLDMIEKCENGESCLPDQGLFRGGYYSASMTQRFCSMYLPEGHRQMENPNLLMVLPPEPGSEDHLANKLGSLLEGKTNTIVLVPQSHGFSSLTTARSAYHSKLAIEWAQNLFNSGAITLAGVGNGTDAAMETSLARPDLCQEILLDMNFLFRDLGEFSAGGISEVLKSRNNERPYYLASVSPSAKRPSLIANTLERAGLNAIAVSVDPAIDYATWLSSWFLSPK